MSRLPDRYEYVIKETSPNNFKVYRIKIHEKYRNMIFSNYNAAEKQLNADGFVCSKVIKLDDKTSKNKPEDKELNKNYYKNAFSLRDKVRQ